LKPFKTMAIACLTAVACIVLSAMPVLAAKSINYPHLYNVAGSAYTSLGNVAGSHNGFVKHHRPHCKGEMHKSWSKKARTDVAAAKSVIKRLSKATKKQRKHALFHDMMKAAKDLAGWGQSHIIGRTGTCKSMPTGSQTVNGDLNQVANDLGLQPVY